MAADRSRIKCWGSLRRSLLVANRGYTWNFLKAAVAFPIIGADFLAAFDLVVDLKRERLVEAGRYCVPLLLLAAHLLLLGWLQHRRLLQRLLRPLHLAWGSLHLHFPQWRHVFRWWHVGEARRSHLQLLPPLRSQMWRWEWLGSSQR